MQLTSTSQVARAVCPTRHGLFNMRIKAGVSYILGEHSTAQAAPSAKALDPSGFLQGGKTSKDPLVQHQGLDSLCEFEGNIFKKIFILYYFCLFIGEHSWCRGMCVVVRGQPAEVGPLLPPSESHGARTQARPGSKRPLSQSLSSSLPGSGLLVTEIS